MHWLLEPSARRRAAVILAALAGGPVVASCYSTGNGTLPPPESFYFPVGMAVSKGGNVLYVVNSDFDLQWNGGTIQSYDLNGIRQDAAISAVAPLSSLLPILPPRPTGLYPYGLPSFFADGGLISPCA